MEQKRNRGTIFEISEERNKKAFNFAEKSNNESRCGGYEVKPSN